MKIIAASLLIAVSLSACVPGDTSPLTMSGIRTHTGAGETYCGPKRWMECDQSKVPSQANGGGE
jgi:hypothetical protein